MPTVNFEIPNRTINALAGIYGYQSTIPDNGGQIPNPETKNQFAKRMVIEHLKRITLSWEKDERARIAEVNAAVNPEELIVT